MMTDQVMANDEIDEENNSAERVFRRGDDSAILRLSESEVQAYAPDDDRRMVIIWVHNILPHMEFCAYR
ncbi:MAG: hypothetical protein Ct9H90mP30_1490 [Actinomycetota bacterium]|nr:MAG: hypothetical protein Ct9H90mP30_1490 [Actinomycetota bacterium]